MKKNQNLGEINKKNFLNTPVEFQINFNEIILNQF